MTAEEAREKNSNREVQLGVLNDVELWQTEECMFRLKIGDESVAILTEPELRAMSSLISYYFSDQRHLDTVFSLVQDGSMDEIEKGSRT